MNEGVVFVAYGTPALRAAAQSQETLCKVSNRPIARVDESNYDSPGYGARFAKLNIDQLVPEEWEKVLYLDADTLVHGSVDVGFQILDAGWDLVIVPSLNQGAESLKHLTEDDRNYTQQKLGQFLPFQLQGGVFWFHKERCQDFFTAWREEWLTFGRQDQGALLRALYREPVKIWLLGRAFNGLGKDVVIQHTFGAAVSRRFM